MRMTEEMLEILIGKYLDGEITPSEQRMLDGAMKKDPGASELVEQLEELHEASTEVVTSEIVEKGESGEEIIERAWGRRQPVRWRILRGGALRFAAGFAAGLLIGLALHFVVSNGSATGRNEIEPKMIARDKDNQFDIERIAPSLVGGDVVRNVDYYGFTDEAGDHWLVEWLRENKVRPAVYYGDL
jgi:hypothetical protein